MKKALLAGYGGIGKNVYYPELTKLGYDIDIFDTMHEDAKIKNIDEIKTAYDIAVVCTPNFTHGEIGTKLADTGTKQVFIEKPGLRSAGDWIDLTDKFPDTSFHLVKNNLYREHYGNALSMLNLFHKNVIGVDINWLNNNRIPNPGSWFTNKEKAFGGVSRDLMPHLYCFAVKLFGEDGIAETEFAFTAIQRWNLGNISNTDYGTVFPNGIYNVDDYARCEGVVGFKGNKVSLRMTASWKEGYDKQSITLFFKDGTSYEWSFGLCPAEAYGKMLQDSKNSDFLDSEIHMFLENFYVD